MIKNPLPIQLLVFDVDGVLTQGEAKSLDLPLLQLLAEMNRAARRDPAETSTLYDLAIAALGPLQESVDLLYSTSCLNVMPRGFHEGQGIEFLSRQTGCALEEMLGVGDSDVDLPFLTKVGYSAAPANACPKIKRLVQYVAPRPCSDGVRILDHFGLML